MSDELLKREVQAQFLEFPIELLVLSAILSLALVIILCLLLGEVLDETLSC